jgi:hypothetical protein
VPQTISLCKFVLTFIILFLSLAGYLMSPRGAFAQTGSAALSGRVTDQSGAVVPDVEVEIKNVDTNVTQVTKTNGDGIYSFTALRPGNYLMNVRKQSFRTVSVTGVELHTQDSLERNFALQVGSSAESVTVNANDVHMQTTDPAVGLLVDRTFVENMPLNGRSFQDLISLAPGVVQDNNSFGLYSINGQYGDANYFTVDGVAANTNSAVLTVDPRGLAGVLPAQTALGTTQSLISVDALQEFKIQTSSYSAENGRQPGGQIQLTSRSGSNDVHGTLYDYFRNEAFDANSWVLNSEGIPRPPHRQNDFGGTLGAPILIPRIYNGRDKTFAFVSYEGLRLTQPQVGSGIVPTVAFRQFASPALQPLLNANPLPNGPELGDACAASLNPSYTFSCSAQWSGVYSNPSSIDSLGIRVDQIIGERLQLFLRYADTPSQTTAFGLATPSTEQTTTQNSHGLTVGITWRLSEALVDELRFNWTNNGGHQMQLPAAIDGATIYPRSLLVPPQFAGSNTPADGAFLIFLPAPYSEVFGAPFFTDFRSNVQQYNLVNSLAWTQGSHSLKFGGDFRRLQSLYNGFQYGANYNLFSVNSVQEGIADQISIQALQPGRPTFTNLSLYAQDTWKLSSRLTVDYGVRWEFNPVPGASDGIYPLALTTGDLATAQLAPKGTPQYKTRYLDFAPRIGFAYQLNSVKSVTFLVRGGYGIFYDTGQSLGAAGYQGYPFLASSMITDVSLPAPANQLAPPSLNFPLIPPYGFLYLNNPHLAVPYTEQWNLAVSAGLSPRNTFTVTYVGNGGRKLLFTSQYQDLSVTNPLFTGMSFTSNASSSSYNALQIQDQGYVLPGMQLIASYTWAHAIDNASGDQTAFPPLRGDSNNDIRQALNAAINYRIPGATSGRFVRALSDGWSLDARFTAQSGVPFDVVQGYYSVFPGNASAPIRPDLVHGVPIILRNAAGDPFGWALNPAAFSEVPLNPDGSPVRLGTLPRNFIHGPGFWNVTTAAQRAFPVNERLQFIFRVEAFNVLNHANGYIPDYCLCDGPLFGKIGPLGYTSTLGVPNPLYATGSARSLQLMLKMQF